MAFGLYISIGDISVVAAVAMLAVCLLLLVLNR